MGLIIVMGGLTLWLKDKTFFMWKPTLINWLFAAAFILGTVFTGKPLVQRLLNGSIDLPDNVWSRLNWLWVGFFVVSGEAVPHCLEAAKRESNWADFKLFGLLGLTVIFILAQAFYLAKHMPEEALADSSDEENSKENT